MIWIFSAIAVVAGLAGAIGRGVKGRDAAPFAAGAAVAMAAIWFALFWMMAEPGPMSADELRLYRAAGTIRQELGAGRDAATLGHFTAGALAVLFGGPLVIAAALMVPRKG